MSASSPDVVIDDTSRSLPATSFVGRDAEMHDLISMVIQPDVRLVTLLGPGGVGKTRLALQAASVLANDSDLVIAFASLASVTDPANVLPEVARSLGVRGQPAIPLEDLIANAVRDREVLLILDNLEQVINGLSFLPKLLAVSPYLTVLVTSRIVLRFSMERIFTVEPLASGVSRMGTPPQYAPATELFVERAMAVAPSLHLSAANVAAIDEICRQLDGLPLAIELAAARSRFFSPPILLERISDRLHLLVNGPRDLPARHRTLRALLAWSFELLEPAARILVRRLSIFTGGGAFEAVDPVCNPDGDLGSSAAEILGQLVDQSLVHVNPDAQGGMRFRMLNVVRDFAHEELILSGEEPRLHAAHSRYFASFVSIVSSRSWRTGSVEAAEWTRRLLPDQGNFLNAISWLAEDGQYDTVMNMIGDLGAFWLDIGFSREGRVWIARVMPFVGSVSPEVRALVYRIAGVMALDGYEMTAAVVHARAALREYEGLGDVRMIAASKNALGILLSYDGDRLEWEPMLRESIALVRSIDDRSIGYFYSANLGETLRAAGEMDLAEPLLEEAIAGLSGERSEAAQVFSGSLGAIVLERGDLDRASDLLEMSLAYHREPPHRQPRMFAERLMSIAVLAARRGYPQIGARMLGASAGIQDRLGIMGRVRLKTDFQATVEELHAALGELVYQVAWDAGRMLSTSQAIAEALEVTRIGAIAAQQSSLLAALTPREREVLHLLIDGRPTIAIANELFVSPRTVTTHLSRLYAKLGVSSRSEAVVLALRVWFS